MANNKISDFENILQQRHSKKPPVLIYSNSVNRTVAHKLNTSCNVKQIISNVNAEIKMIQSADRNKTRKVGNTVNKLPKTQFMPLCSMINNKNIQDVPQTSVCQNKFETQYVTDTQLLHVIENAEAVHHNNEEITNNFNSTFDTDLQINNEEFFDNIINDIEKKSPSEKISISIAKVNVENFKINEQNFEAMDNIANKNQNLYESQISCRSTSPILNIKPFRRKSTSFSPLVYDLEAFEKFETIALPIIQENNDLESVKHLINSQIIGNELHINTDMDNHIKLKNISLFVINSTEIQTEVEKEKEIDKITFLKDLDKCLNKDSDILIDEILFSSDEENSKIIKQSYDLPLTCALETSFYSESDILDKTMYVAFQTASNKSIQICTDSFYKAKQVYENVSKESSRESNVNESVNIDFREVENLNAKNTENTNIVLGPENIDNKLDILSHKASEKSIDILEDDLIEIDRDPTNEHHKIFQGFKTASNKVIKLSEQALTRCKRVFQDIDLNDKFEDKMMDNMISKKAQIKPSQEAPSVQNIVDNRIIDEFENCDMIEHIDVNTKKITPFVGFKTATNKNIKISKSALMKCRDIFKDIDLNEKSGGKLPENIETCQNSYVGFKTASNKKIDISKKALSETKNIFKDIEIDIFDDKIENLNDYAFNIYNTEVKNTLPELFGDFETDNNKKIKISREATEKSKSVFQDIDHNHNDAKNNSFVGFKTANNKPIMVNSASLVKTKEMFKDLNDEYLMESSKLSYENTFVGFQTANNKQIDVSKDALTKTNELFKENKEDMKCDHITDTKPIFSGFKTGNNKTIKVSDAALAKTVDFFKDTDENFNTIENTVIFKGFKTASNKNIKISSAALAKSKKLLDEVEVNDNQKDILSREDRKEPPNFSGFQTANKKPVKISAQALTQSKILLKDIHENPIPRTNTVSDTADLEMCQDKYVNSKIKQKTNNYKPFIGFKTGNKTKICVSKEAIAKIKSLLDGKEITDDFTKLKSPNKTDVSACFKSKELLQDIGNKLRYSQNKDGNYENCNKNEMKIKDSGIDDIINMIDTQVINNFEVTLNTEDFCEVATPKVKREGSPILSCPRAKKRKKFETPFKSDLKDDANKVDKPIPHQIIKDNSCRLQFDNNYKKCKKYAIKDLESIEKECNLKINIDPYILRFNFDSLLQFIFTGKRNELSNEDLSIEMMKKIFLNSINEKIVPDGWLDNHIRLILWKLISYEIKYPHVMDVVCTAKNVIDQLKYRYDRELYNVERPALRKMLEKDDVASKLLVLCVVGVYVEGVRVNSVANLTDKIELLLTDGWYCIRACIDPMLSKIVYDNKIVVGTKIVTHGAELFNCEQGVSPWEDISSVRLKIFGNSTRRARYDIRLGYHGNAAMLTHLSDVRLDGGKVSKIRVFVTRVYPPLYVEKFEDGSTVTRSERLEHIHQMKYETERQNLMEKIYEEVEKEYLKEESQDSASSLDSDSKRKDVKCQPDKNKLRKLQDCNDMQDSFCMCCYNAFEQSMLPILKAENPSLRLSQLKQLVWKEWLKSPQNPNNQREQSQLTTSQLNKLQRHAEKQRERIMKELESRFQDRLSSAGLNNRNVVTLLKIRIIGAHQKNGTVDITKSMMSIWRPNDSLTEVIKEGSWIEILNIVPTAFRYSEIQLSAGRQSIFSQSKYKENDTLTPHIKSIQRTCHEIEDLVKYPMKTTEYNEIDTVGMIFQIEPSTKEFDSLKNQQFQNVYFTDGDKNLICVNFWGGMKKFGYQNILDTGQIFACINLQKRVGNTRKNVPQFRATEFSYFTKTPKYDKPREIVAALTKKFSILDKRKYFEECVVLKNNYALLKRPGNENVSPYRFNNDHNISKNRMFIDSPSKNIAEDIFNLSGLDFESTFKQESQDISPQMLLRKKQIKEKIAKLKMYGEPPPLYPIQIINKSANAKNAFKSPMAKSDVSPSVANTEKNIPIGTNAEAKTMLQSSPLLNQTYVKSKSIIPVKLNFCNAIDCEDENNLDGSPPLSLDSSD